MPTSPHWEVTNSPKIFAFWNYILPGGSRVRPYEAYWKSGLPDDRESARFLLFQGTRGVPWMGIQSDCAHNFCPVVAR